MYQIIWFPLRGAEGRSEAASLEELDFDTVKDRTLWVVRVRGVPSRKLADVDIVDQPEKASEAAAIVREELLTRHRMGIFPCDPFRVGNRFGPPRPLYTSPRAAHVETWEGNNNLCGNLSTIDYTPGLRVSNIDQLPPGAGARYLEAFEPHDLDLPLIAVQWRRRLPDSLPAGHLLIKF